MHDRGYSDRSISTRRNRDRRRAHILRRSNELPCSNQVFHLQQRDENVAGGSQSLYFAFQ